jgi:26S proteasome regulatory subunit, ATPase 3, interacting protein
LPSRCASVVFRTTCLGVRRRCRRCRRCPPPPFRATLNTPLPPKKPPTPLPPEKQKQDFGKTKLYIPPQGGLEVLTKEQIDALKQQAQAHRRAAQLSAQRARQLDAELRLLESRPTVEQLEERCAQLEAQRAELEQRAAPLRAAGAELVTPAQRAAAEASLSRCLREWRRRKGVFNAVWDAVSEGIEGKQADLFEEMGVETDEAAGVSMQEVASLLPAGSGGAGGGAAAAGGRKVVVVGFGSAAGAPPQAQQQGAAGGAAKAAAAPAAKKARAS